MVFKVGDGPPADQSHAPFETIGQAVQTVSKVIGHLDPLGRWRKFHQRSVKIEKQREWPVGLETGDFGRKRKGCHRRPV